MYRYTHTWMETPVISWLVTKVSWMQVNNVCLHLFDAAFSKWNLFSFNYRNSYHIVLIIWSKFITAYFSRNTRTHDNYYVILRYRYSPQDLICIFLACVLTRNIRLISIFGLLFFPRFVPHGNQMKQIQSGNVITDSIFNQYMEEQIRRRREGVSSLCQKSCHRCIFESG